MSKGRRTQSRPHCRRRRCHGFWQCHLSSTSSVVAPLAVDMSICILSRPFSLSCYCSLRPITLSSARLPLVPPYPCMSLYTIASQRTCLAAPGCPATPAYAMGSLFRIPLRCISTNRKRGRPAQLHIEIIDYHHTERASLRCQILHPLPTHSTNCQPYYDLVLPAHRTDHILLRL